MLMRRGPCATNLEAIVVPWLRFAIFCSSLLVWGSPASAQTVALLRPPAQSPSTTELLQRLRGELLSVGFEVMVRERPPAPAGSEPWRKLLTTAGIDAAVDLVGDIVPTAVDVWLIDEAHHLQLLARVALDTSTENASKGLAIRASEALRAHLFEPHTAATAEHAPAPAASLAATVAEADGEKELHSRRLGFELGAAVLVSLDGIGPALLPLVRFDWAIASELVLQATLVGLGTQPRIETSAGHAQVATQYGLLGACYRSLGVHRVRAIGGLSLGALRTAVAGQADLPREGHSVEQWSLLMDGSLGAVFELSRQYTVVLAGHVQLAQPSIGIHFGDQKVASAGRPNLLMTLTFGVWP
jgi:hypothetical protein